MTFWISVEFGVFKFFFLNFESLLGVKALKHFATELFIWAVANFNIYRSQSVIYNRLNHFTPNLRSRWFLIWSRLESGEKRFVVCNSFLQNFGRRVHESCIVAEISSQMFSLSGICMDFQRFCLVTVTIWILDSWNGLGDFSCFFWKKRNACFRSYPEF